MRQSSKTTTALLLLAGGLLAVTATATAATYCWKDDSGQTQCGDHVPPQYSNKDRNVLNESGQTIKILPHAKTDAELAADARAEKERQAKMVQDRDDQYLLSTFESLDGLKKMRDERLEALDGSIRINEMTLKNTQASVDELKARKQRIISNGRKPDPGLDKQVLDYQTRLANDKQGIENRKAERAALASKFDRDIARYRMLKGEGSGTAAASAAGSAPNQGANTNVGK